MLALIQITATSFAIIMCDIQYWMTETPLGTWQLLHLTTFIPYSNSIPVGHDGYSTTRPRNPS